eukprot:418178_1
MSRKQLIDHKKICKIYTQRLKLNNKNKNNTNNKSFSTFKCNFNGCNKIFMDKKTFSVHIIRHNKPYKCSFGGCNKSFGSKWDLKIHIRIHNGIKKEKCSYCLLKFSDPSAKRRHIKRFHNQIIICKPYVCRLCKKQFKGKDGLKKHLMIHIPRDKRHLKICQKCNIKFVNDQCLQRHNTKFHS